VGEPDQIPLLVATVCPTAGVPLTAGSVTITGGVSFTFVAEASTTTVST
jgi:hypothetical protein